MRTTLLIASAAFALNPAVVHADVVVTTFVTADLTIQPAAGSVQFLSPSAFAFAQAQDSLSGLDANSSSGFFALTSAGTALANADGLGFPGFLFIPNLAAADSGVNIPNIAASAPPSDEGNSPRRLRLLVPPGPLK